MPLRSAFTLLFTAAFLVAGCGDEKTQQKERAAEPATEPAQPAASPEARIMRRVDFDRGDYRGRVLLLNFWATWCAPCRAEMPDLVKIQQDLKDKDFQIVGISEDRQGREVVAPFLSKQPLNYPVVLDPEGELGNSYGGIAALPTSFLIGPGGSVKARIVGRVRAEQLRRRIARLLRDGKEDRAAADSTAGSDPEDAPPHFIKSGA